MAHLTGQEILEQQKNSAVYLEGKKTLRARKLKRGLFIGGMLSVALIQFLIFWVYVNIDSILMAFEVNIGGKLFWGLDNFIQFFKQLPNPYYQLDVALKNTFLLFFVATVVGLPASLIFAYFLFKKIWWSGFFRVVFFLPSIMSAAVLVGLFKYLVAYNGPVNTILNSLFGMAPIDWINDDAYSFNTILFYVFWTGFGGNIVLFTGAIHRVPAEVLEYAEIDGVGMTRELFQIIVPLIWPTFSTLVVFAFAGLFTNAGPILLFTKGNHKTMTLGYFIFDQVTEKNSYQYPAAIGLIFTVVGFPLVLFVKWLMNKIIEDVEY